MLFHTSLLSPHYNAFDCQDHLRLYGLENITGWKVTTFEHNCNVTRRHNVSFLCSGSLILIYHTHGLFWVQQSSVTSNFVQNALETKKRTLSPIAMLQKVQTQYPLSRAAKNRVCLRQSANVMLSCWDLASSQGLMPKETECTAMHPVCTFF